MAAGMNQMNDAENPKHGGGRMEMEGQIQKIFGGLNLHNQEIEVVIL